MGFVCPKSFAGCGATAIRVTHLRQSHRKMRHKIAQCLRNSLPLSTLQPHKLRAAFPQVRHTRRLPTAAVREAHLHRSSRKMRLPPLLLPLGRGASEEAPVYNGSIMPLIDQVQKDMVAAMKAREEARLSALRMIKAALMKAKVDSPKPLDDAAEMQVLKSLIKQRTDAAEMFRKAGRTGQAEKEEAERTLIESYLPAAATDADMDAAVAAAIAETGVTSLKQMGVVMKAAQARLQGKTVDGKKLSEKVRSKLQ